MMKKKKIVIIISLIAACTGLLNSQTMKYGFFRETDFITGFSMQSWNTSNDKITEISVPVTIIVPVSKKLVINVGTNSAFANLNSAENKLNGLTDSRISASYITLDDHLLITGGVSIPTGRTTLEGDQSSVASALAVYPLSFNVPSFGQGLALNLAGIYAFKTGNFILGGGAGFVYKNGFKPSKDNDLKYQPGSEISLNLGGETNANMRVPVKFTFDVTYTLYGADKYDGKDIFKSGGKLIADLRSLFKVGQTDMVIFLRERTKGKNEKGWGSLSTEDKNSNGNQIEAGYLAYIPTSEKFGIKGLVDLKLYSKNEYESNGAMIGGVGAGFNFMPTNHFGVEILFKYSAGSLKNKDISTTVTGIEVDGGIKIRL
jgi:hypothetical protein